MGIKAFVKKNRYLATVAHQVRGMRNRLMMRLYSNKKIDFDKVLFYRSGGGYGDNPRAVAEYLHKNYPEIKLIWAYGNDYVKDTIPPYVHAVKFESNEYLREITTAGAWVCSTILPTGTIKRKGQLYIQTWHGDKGFKKFARDATSDLKQLSDSTSGREIVEQKICDYFLTGAKWFIPKIRSAIGYRGAIIAHGLPRNDCLFNIDPNLCSEIRKKLDIPENVKLLIYAPTFRDHEKSHEIVDSDINLPAIVKSLEQKTCESWICLLRAHGGQKLMYNIEDRKNQFVDVTSYPDMADLILISDMMITDYSSCAGDFALKDKFVLLYQDDIASYTGKDRTLYFNMEDTPYYIAHNTTEALNIINNIDEEKIVENCKAIRGFYQVCETGSSCKEVVEIIIKNREKQKAL